MSKRAVSSDAALVWHQLLSVCSYIFRRDSAHLDVGSSAVQVLGICSTANGGVSFGSSVCRCDCHRLSKMCPDFLQHGHQLVRHEDRIGTVRTREFLYFEICR